MIIVQDEIYVGTAAPAGGGGSAILITKNITQNGTYSASSDNADGYSSVTVDVNTDSLYPLEIVDGILRKPSTPNYNFILNANVTNIEGDELFERALDFNGTVIGVDFSNVQYIIGNGTFSQFLYGSPSVEYVVFYSLVEISGEETMSDLCHGNTSLNSVSFQNLTTLNGNNIFMNAFAESALEFVEFPSLTSITGSNTFTYAYTNCQNLRSISFPVLEIIGDGTFEGMCMDSTIQEIYFNSLLPDSLNEANNQFFDMLCGVNNCTVHFPSNLQSVIGNWQSVIDGFSGTNTTILFDLPATE